MVGIHIRNVILWSPWHLKLPSATSKNAAITKLGGNAYQNERVALLHVTYPKHVEVIKTTVSKFELMKDVHPYKRSDIWLCDTLINEERHITTFAKAFRHHSRKTKKKKNKSYLFVKFKGWMINTVCWNKLKPVRRKGMYLPEMAHHWDAKQFPNIISLALFSRRGHGPPNLSLRLWSWILFNIRGWYYEKTQV